MVKSSKNFRYIFIFDYFDMPLFFIAKIKDNYYMYYCMNEFYYIKCLLNKAIIDKIFSGDSIFNILEFSKKNFEIIEENHGILRTIPLSLFETENNDKIENYFPNRELYIEYDYLNDLNFNKAKKIYKQYFPEFYNIKNISLRLRDRENSKSLPVNYVVASLKFVDKLIKQFRINMEVKNYYDDSILEISSFSPGSFKINFNLKESKQVNLTNSQINFDNLIDFISNIEYQNPKVLYKSYAEKNINIIKETKKYCTFLKDNYLYVEFIKNKKRIFSLKPNKNITDKLDKIIDEYSQYEEKSKTEYFQVRGEVLSASTKRNSFTIQLENGQTISGMFSDILFGDIKSGVLPITVSKFIIAKLEKRTVFDENNINVKYIMNSFVQ